MITIGDNYILRKLTLADIDAVMQFKCYSDVVLAMDYINQFNQYNLVSSYDYYAICYLENIIGVVSFNPSISKVINLECRKEYVYAEDFNLVINHIKSFMYDKDIIKFSIEVSPSNDSITGEICKSGFNYVDNKFVNAFKTLVFNGSPKNGTSKKICNQLLERYEDIDIINAYDYNIKACTDCGFCSKHACECVYNDMDDIYKMIEDAANIIIVSPIHVGSISAPLLAMFSRLQIYFANKFVLKNNYPFAKKQGYGIVVSGKDWEGQRNGARVILKHALLEMNANFNYYCYLTNTDSNSDFSSQLNGFYEEVDKYVR